MQKLALYIVTWNDPKLLNFKLHVEPNDDIITNYFLFPHRSVLLGDACQWDYLLDSQSQFEAVEGVGDTQLSL